MKAILSVCYNPATNMQNSDSIGFGDIILVKKDGTCHVIDESKETLDFGYKNDVLLIQDYSCRRELLSDIRAILLINGRDFNKALIPDLTRRKFIVKNLQFCDQLADRSVRTDSALLQMLQENFVS